MDTQDLSSVAKTLTVQEAASIKGGVSITGSIITAANAVIKTLLDVGRALGTAIRRFKNKKVCEL